MVGWLRYSAVQYSASRPRNYTNYLLPIVYYQFEEPAYVVSTILLVIIAKNVYQV